MRPVCSSFNQGILSQVRRQLLFGLKGSQDAPGIQGWVEGRTTSGLPVQVVLRCLLSFVVCACAYLSVVPGMVVRVNGLAMVGRARCLSSWRPVRCTSRNGLSQHQHQRTTPMLAAALTNR